MGVFNFFIVIPQLIASAILGFVIKDIFHGQGIYALVIGGFSMIIGGFLNFIVKDNDVPSGELMAVHIAE